MGRKREKNLAQLESVRVKKRRLQAALQLMLDLYQEYEMDEQELRLQRLLVDDSEPEEETIQQNSEDPVTAAAAQKATVLQAWAKADNAWILLGHDGSLKSWGNGSVDEMRQFMEQNPEEVLYGLLRMGFGTNRLRRVKYVLVTAVGPEASAVLRGRALGDSTAPSELRSLAPNVSTHVMVQRPEEYTLQLVVDKVRQAACIDEVDLISVQSLLCISESDKSSNKDQDEDQEMEEEEEKEEQGEDKHVKTRKAFSPAERRTLLHVNPKVEPPSAAWRLYVAVHGHERSERNVLRKWYNLWEVKRPKARGPKNGQPAVQAPMAAGSTSSSSSASVADPLSEWYNER